jgi:chromosome segregation ATPase
MSENYANGSNGGIRFPVELIQSHEERLQSVQSEVSDTRSEVTECKANIKALSDQFSEGNARTIEMLNAGFARVTEMVKPLQETAIKLDKQVLANSDKISHLEGQEKLRMTRKQKIKTTAIGLMVAGGSAVVGKFGGLIGSWLTGLMGG